MKIIYYGHAALGLEIKGKNIVVDPFISGNPLAENIKIDEIPADYILITHAHQDHVLDVEAIAKRTGAVIVSNAEIAGYYEAKRLKTHPMNHGGSWNFDFGKLTYTNSVHSSSFADGTYGGQPGGFVIKADKNIYIAGDTALTMDMKLIPMRTKLDLAVLPIGDNFTMDVEDALIATDFLQVNKVLGYHYDTFGYIKIDKNKAKELFSQKSKELILLEIGEGISL
ncbi:metal-dependent hydrolase [Capnocytophaga sp. ARDL2]|uniref:metal-dependent hydrolase n=1 Tax=Capnocytophaga sp. ARDL2 TaxID=3238809 RepID=UPI003559133C